MKIAEKVLFWQFFYDGRKGNKIIMSEELTGHTFNYFFKKLTAVTSFS